MQNGLGKLIHGVSITSSIAVIFVAGMLYQRVMQNENDVQNLKVSIERLAHIMETERITWAPYLTLVNTLADQITNIQERNRVIDSLAAERGVVLKDHERRIENLERPIGKNQPR